MVSYCFINIKEHNKPMSHCKPAFLCFCFENQAMLSTPNWMAHGCLWQNCIMGHFRDPQAGGSASWIALEVDKTLGVPRLCARYLRFMYMPRFWQTHKLYSPTRITKQQKTAKLPHLQTRNMRIDQETRASHNHRAAGITYTYGAAPAFKLAQSIRT